VLLGVAGPAEEIPRWSFRAWDDERRGSSSTPSTSSASFSCSGGSVGASRQLKTSMNVRVEPRIRVRRLVSEAVQLAHLLEQRLELGVVDRHY
jgi:hypothetical protein